MEDCNRVVLCAHGEPEVVDMLMAHTTYRRVIGTDWRVFRRDRVVGVPGLLLVIRFHENDWVVDHKTCPAGREKYLLGIKGPFIITKCVSTYRSLVCEDIKAIFAEFEKWKELFWR